MVKAVVYGSAFIVGAAMALLQVAIPLALVGLVGYGFLCILGGY